MISDGLGQCSTNSMGHRPRGIGCGDVNKDRIAREVTDASNELDLEPMDLQKVLDGYRIRTGSDEVMSRQEPPTAFPAP